MSGFPHLRAAIQRRPWAMSPDWLAALAEVVERRANGEEITPEKFAEAAKQHSQISRHATILGQTAANGEAIDFMVTEAGLVARGRGGEQRVDGSSPEAGSVIAVISVMGVIAQHAHQVESISGPGGTSTQRVGESLDRAMADPAVKAVVFNVDSPGGNVHGVQELADKMMGHRGKKPMIAQVNSTAGSAAYWIIANCDEIVVPPSGEVGSVGVYCLHANVQGKNEKDGVAYTFIKADDSPFKVEGNPYEPIEGDALKYRQAQTNSYMQDFLSGISRGRGVPVAKVRSDFGQGRMKRAKEAVASGMADKIGTMEQTLQRVAKMKAGQGMRALDQAPTNLALTFADGSAAVAETFEVETQPEPEPPAPPAATEQSAEDRNAYRRRAFMLRMRQG
jgi:signal peptide peptidase SppA